MIYVNFLGGLMFFDNDSFDYSVVGNDLYLFDSYNIVARVDKECVLINDSDDEIIYKGEKYNE